MRLVSIKADGLTHRVWLGVTRTSSPYAYFVPAGAPVKEHSGAIWSSAYPVIALFWPKQYYQVFMLLKPEQTDYYCNIIAPALIANDVVFIDLDLDVLVTDGIASVVDEEEFENRAHMYPEYWRREARSGVNRLLGMAERKEGPFRPAEVAFWRAFAERMNT